MRVHLSFHRERIIGVASRSVCANDYLDDALSVFEREGLNYSIWSWDPATWPEETDGFDLSWETDPEHHDSVDSDSIAILKRYWGRNTEHPGGS